MVQSGAEVVVGGEFTHWTTRIIKYMTVAIHTDRLNQPPSWVLGELSKANMSMADTCTCVCVCVCV